MLKSPRFQFPNSILFGNANLACFVSDLTYSSYGNAVNALGEFIHVLRSHGKEQFKIFTAMKRQH